MTTADVASKNAYKAIGGLGPGVGGFPAPEKKNFEENCSQNDNKRKFLTPAHMPPHILEVFPPLI
jgi:hypothetical protein